MSDKPDATAPPETLLLTWNPSLFPWGSLQDELADIRKSGRATDSWSVGNRTTVQPGSRFFLVRLGVEPKGLVGSGWTTSTPFEGPHWDPEKKAKGKLAQFVELYFDALGEEPIITLEELQQEPFSQGRWSPHNGGIRIPAEVTDALEALWMQRTGGVDPGGRDEFAKLPPKVARHSTRVHVNRYERDPRARAICLAHHGLKCKCCDVLLADVYGDAASELVHVHHLKPLSEIPEGTPIDPVNDLSPVCPNCHCVIHAKQPPFSIEEVRAMLSKRRKRPRA